MGLSNYPNPQDGLLPMIAVSVVLVATFLKSTARSLLGPAADGPSGRSPAEETSGSGCEDGWRRVSVVQFGSLSLCHGGGGGGGGGLKGGAEQCCVCLCGFEEEEEVSELRCRHCFHRVCLQQWFDNLCIRKLTCPLCRSLI